MYSALGSRPSVFLPGFSSSPRGSSAAGGGGAAPEAPTLFLALSQSSGSNHISDSLTLNGAASTAIFSYGGDAATALTWLASQGPNLPIASSGTDPTIDRYTPATEEADRAVRFAGGKVYQAADALTQLTTQDFVLEVMFRSGLSTGTIFATRGAGAGISIDQPSATQVRVIVFDGSASSSVTETVGTGWVHFLLFCDRSEASSDGVRSFLNGTIIGSGDFSAVSGSLAGAAATLGALADFSSKWSGELAAVRLWGRAAWLPGGASNSTIAAAAAKERAALLFGMYPELVTGSAAPTAISRSSSAYLDRVVDEGTHERRLFLVTANWLRLGRRREAGGDYFTGAILEAQSTNLLLRSEELDNASWTKAASTISANASAAPTGDTVADAIIADNTNAAHGVTQDATLTVASYVLSAFVKAGAATHVYLSDSTIANGRAWFNLGTGAVGTVEAGIAEALIEAYGNGWFRISARFTGTAAAHTLGVFAATADNDADFTGDGATVSIHAWGAQCELTLTGEPSTYIATTTATATRTIDTLQYKMDDGNLDPAEGQLSADVLHLSRDMQGDHMLVLCSAGAASTTDSLSVATNTSDQGRARGVVGGAAQFDIAGTTDVYDGDKHNVCASWEANEGKLLVDGAQEGATDATVTVLGAAPAVMTVGALSTTASSNGLIGNVRVRSAAA
jgi:hypothetical protein